MAIDLDIDELEERSKWDRIWMLVTLLLPTLLMFLGLLGMVPLIVGIALLLPSGTPDWVAAAVVAGAMMLTFVPVFAVGWLNLRRRANQARLPLGRLIGERGLETRRRLMRPILVAIALTTLAAVVLVVAPVWAPVPQPLQGFIFVVLLVSCFAVCFLSAVFIWTQGKLRERLLQGGARGGVVLLALPVLRLDEAAAWVWPALPYSDWGQSLGTAVVVLFLLMLAGSALVVTVPMARAMRAVARGDWDMALAAHARRPAVIGSMIHVEALVGAGQFELVEEVARDELRYVPVSAVYSLMDRLAEATLRRGDVDEADATWGALLQLNGNSAPALVGLSRCRLARGTADAEALEWVELALERFSRSLPPQPTGRVIEAHATRVRILMALGQSQDAVRERVRVDELLDHRTTSAWSRSLTLELLNA